VEVVKFEALTLKMEDICRPRAGGPQCLYNTLKTRGL